MLILCLGAVSLSGSPRRAAAQRPLNGPSPVETMAAHNAVKSWIRAWDVPIEPQRVDPAGATGACVTLRLAGVVVGRATHMSDAGDAVHAAARKAWIEANSAMPVERDALRNEALRDHAQRVAIDLQVSGPLVPLPARRLEALALEFSPGWHGVAMRLGARTETIFPGVMLATNTTPEQALSAVAGALELPRIGIGDPRIDVERLQNEQGLVVARFSVQHLAQPGAGAPPVFLHRGGRIVPRAEVSLVSLRAHAERLLDHILTRRWPGDEPFGLMGVHRPWLGDYEEPIVAAPFEQALAAFALARAARSGVFPGARADEARRAALRIIEQLADVAGPEQSPAADPAGAAMFVLAWEEAVVGATAPSERARALRDECVRAILEASAAPGALAPGRRAVVAAALGARAVSADTAPPLVDPQIARDSVRALFRETPAGDVAALLPWLGWAELALAPSDGPVLSEIALRDMRSLVWRHQVQTADVDEDGRDLVGGVVFTRGRAPLPSWHTMRPLAFIATMLGDDRLTDAADVPAEAARLLASLRFVMQLTVSDAEMHMFRDRARALGGARLAPWDQRQSLEASSLALLTIAEAVHSAERRAPAAPAPGADR